MTKDQRTILSEKHSRKIKTFERKHLKPVFDAVHSQILSFVRILRKQGIDQARRSLDSVIINDQIAPVLKDLYIDAGVYFARRALRQINVSARGRVEQKAGFGFDAEWINAIIQYLNQYLLNKAVVPVTETTKRQILQILIEGQQQGWGVDKIATKLESSELTLWRARMIVRTELNKAMFRGHQLGAEKSKWETEDTWIAAHDHRTRHSHRIVDGDVIGTGGRFKVPVFKRIGKVDIQTGFDLMEGPGDPRASAANIINCRCSKVTRAKRDESGRLIPKQQRLLIQ